MNFKQNRLSHAIKKGSLKALILGGSAITLASPSAFAQDGAIEEITVTARFRTENLQETPLAITSISGEALDERGLDNLVDLGLAVPNAQLRQSPGQWGPNATIGMRGVTQQEFIYTAEPGVGIYVDDVYHGTLTGSNLDLLDLERVEVLRGPQGTLFGKNSLGGAIRMISKAPSGDETGNVEVTLGTSNRADIKASFDTALTEDLFMRVSAASKQIDGFQDRLDFTCHMNALGTPALAGTLPSRIASNRTAAGDCKIGENGGSDSNAARAMFRYLPTDRLEMNLSADYAKTIADPQAEMLLSRSNPAPGLFTAGTHDATVIQPAFGGLSYTSDDRFLSTRDYNYASYSDPINGFIWSTDQITEAWSSSFKVDYDITDSVHAKAIVSYRTYDSDWVSDGDLTPLDIETATTHNIQTHSQTTVELQLSGVLLDEALEWTVGAFSYESDSELGGLVTLPAFFGGINFNQNDGFTTTSESVFAHAVYDFSEALSLSLGLRYTDEEKAYTFDHTGFLTIPTPLVFGQDRVDWKISLDYQIDEDSMVYGLASTGFRSEGANPRPFGPAQLTSFPGEEMTAYEIGYKTDLFDQKLRLNTAIFLNDYNKRLVGAAGIQCYADTVIPQEPFRGIQTCPAGTDFAGSGGLPWFDQDLASGEATGAELELTWFPIDNLSINGSFGYYNFESDSSVGQIGYLDPSVLLEAKYSYSFGAQYLIALDGGSTLIPRIDWFFQGERTNGDVSTPQLSPQHIVPDYNLVNARITYTSPTGEWTASLAASNLFDEDYFVQLGAATDATGVATFARKGSPGRGREIALTVRRNFF